MLQNLLPVGKELHQKIKTVIRKEIRKGVIRPVKTTDLLLNIISLNVSAFVAAQIFFDMDTEKDNKKLKLFLEERKKNNVEIIINSIKN